jgi:hypothetical protein
MAEKQAPFPTAGRDDEASAEVDPLAKRSDEDQLAFVTRLGRAARLSDDPRTRLAHEDAMAQLEQDTAIPNPTRVSEGEARANRIVELVGDGMPEDKTAPEWSELVRLTGYPLEEIGAARPYDQGVAVLHTAGNGQWYLYVGADHPADAGGRRGIMLLERPRNYQGPFPVYGEGGPDDGSGNRTGMLTTGMPDAPRLSARGPVI